MSDVKPLPCPFCGEVPGIYHPGKGVIIQCKHDQCDVQAETWAWTEHDALDQWNRRALCRQGVPVEELEALEAEMRARQQELLKPQYQMRTDQMGERQSSVYDWCAHQLHALLERHKQQEGGK